MNLGGTGRHYEEINGIRDVIQYPWFASYPQWQACTEDYLFS